jgi:hypothetical protein
MVNSSNISALGPIDPDSVANEAAYDGEKEKAAPWIVRKLAEVRPSLFGALSKAFVASIILYRLCTLADHLLEYDWADRHLILRDLESYWNLSNLLIASVLCLELSPYDTG